VYLRVAFSKSAGR